MLKQVTGLNPEFLHFPWVSFVHASSMAVMYVSVGGCLGVMAKLGPLDRNENCAGVRGLEDNLMTHLLLETEGVAGLLFMGLDVELLVVVVVEILVVSPVVAVLVVVCPSPLLFAGRITLAVSSSIEFNGGHLCEFSC